MLSRLSLLLLLLRCVVIGMPTVLLLRVVVVVAGDASCSVSENFLPIVVLASIVSVGGMCGIVLYMHARTCCGSVMVHSCFCGAIGMNVCM